MNEPFALVLALLVVVALVAFWLGVVRGRGPEDAASRTDLRPDTDSERFYGGVDRPAGPDAENPPDPTTGGEPVR